MKTEIVYSDFITLDWNAVPSEMCVSFPDYLSWISQNNFQALQGELFTNFDLKKLPNRSDDEIIDGMLAASDNEFVKKTKNKNYYECHVCAILSVIRRIFSPDLVRYINAVATDERSKVLVFNYQEILRQILLDVEDLKNLFNENIKDEHKYQSYIRTRYIKPASLHQVLRQGLFGENSFHSFSDKEPSANNSTIRLLIELRIRRAFGCLAFVDTTQNNAVIPLDMSGLFDLLKKYETQIQFPLKLDSIRRIYNWANSFVHSGLSDYSWIPFFLEHALVKFTFSEFNKDGSWNINGGISTTQTVIDTIQEEVIKKKNNGICDASVRYKLDTCKPECAIVP